VAVHTSAANRTSPIFSVTNAQARQLYEHRCGPLHTLILLGDERPRSIDRAGSGRDGRTPEEALAVELTKQKGLLPARS